MKVLSRVQREYEQAISVGAASNTLPRNAFSALEQEKLASMLQASTAAAVSNATNNRHSLLGERSKTLGPGFMRGHHGQPRVESGYVSSPDGGFEGNIMVPSRFSPFPENGRYYPRPESTEEAKARMMHMEAQLNQLTGLVEKALKNKKLGKKTVSFDKSVTYSDDPQPHPQGILIKNKLGGQNISANNQAAIVANVTQALQHRCGASASTASTPGPSGSSGSTSQVAVGNLNGDNSNTEMYSNLKRLHKSARELKQEVRVLRRLTQLQSMAMKDLVQDTYIKLREACISFSTAQNAPLMAMANFDPELWRLAHDEETFVKDLNDLVASICQLEAKVEETRSGVINKKNKISMADVEAMAFTLSKCSKSVTLLKQAFPMLEANMKAKPPSNNETAEKRRMTEDFLKRTPDRMENIWRRCKKLTGTLVTLKRLASVQEQRFHPGSINIDMSLSPTPSEMSTVSHIREQIIPQPLVIQKNGSHLNESPKSIQATLKEDIIKEKETISTKGLHNAEKLKATPPPPPPRSSSTKNSSDEGSETNLEVLSSSEDVSKKGPPPPVAAKPANVDIKSLTARARQEALEQRHQELLTRQKQLQEQYQRLQNMQKQTSSNSTSTISTVTTSAISSGKNSAVMPANGNSGGSSTSSLSSTSSEPQSQSLAVQPPPQQPPQPLQQPQSQEIPSTNQVANKPAPPPLPVRTNSSLTTNTTPSQGTDNQKVYQTDII